MDDIDITKCPKNVTHDGVSLLTLIEVVFAVLINFTNLGEQIHDCFGHSGLGDWIYKCLEGWSCIPFIILSPIIITLVLATAIFTIAFIVVFVITRFSFE